MKFLDKIKLQIKVARWSGEFEEVNNLLKTGENHVLALEILNRILKNESDPIIIQSVYMYKSIALSMIGKYRDVIETIDLMLNMGSEIVEVVLFLKGDALKHLGKYQEASDVYEKVLKTEPNMIDTLINNGFCYNMLERYQEGINNYDRILEIEPYNIKAIRNKALALKKIKKLGNTIITPIMRIEIFEVPDTVFLMLGEQNHTGLWNIFLIDSQIDKKKELIRTNINTETFSKFTETKLNIKFPTE